MNRGCIIERDLYLEGAFRCRGVHIECEAQSGSQSETQSKLCRHRKKQKKGEKGEKGEKSGLVTEIAALFRANIYF